MATVLFLDANVPMYAAGGNHPLKGPCVRVMELAATRPEAFVSDAEVLQEILHRYVAIKRVPEGQDLVLAFAELMRGRIEPIFAGDVEAAARSAGRYPRLDARDLLHVSVMMRLSLSQFVSADSDFDSVNGIERLDPIRVTEWARAMELD